jgi:hypothetical protein
MDPKHSKPGAAADDEPLAGAVAARCFKLAERIGGGPVRDALVAMGRDYSMRAKETAQTAAFRIELEHSREASSSFWPLRVLTDLFAPLPPQPVRREAPAVDDARPAAPAGRAAAKPQVRRAASAVASGAPAKRSPHTSRLFRMHALTPIE